MFIPACSRAPKMPTATPAPCPEMPRTEPSPPLAAQSQMPDCCASAVWHKQPKESGHARGSAGRAWFQSWRRGGTKNPPYLARPAGDASGDAEQWQRCWCQLCLPIFMPCQRVPAQVPSCHAQLNRCSPSLPTLLLTGVPKQLWPPHVSSAQGETSLAGAVPWGCDPRATRGVLLGNITAHYLILAARDAKSLSYQGLMLSQVWVQPPSP